MANTLQLKHKSPQTEQMHTDITKDRQPDRDIDTHTHTHRMLAYLEIHSWYLQASYQRQRQLPRT